MKKPALVLSLVLATLAAGFVYVLFRSSDSMPSLEPSVSGDVVPKKLHILENAPLEREAQAIKAKLSRELTFRLQGVSDDERAAVAAQFREDFSKDLAREQEIEDRIQDAQPSRPDPVFTEKRDEILSIAELIRAGHSVEEAERIHAEKQG